MALLKEIVKSNGIVCKYHRIHSITKDGNQLRVEVYSYASENYREEEKVVYNAKETLDAVVEEYNSLTVSNSEDATEEIIAKREELYAQIKANEEVLIEKSSTMYPIDMRTEIVTLDDTEISYEKVYEKLKETEYYADAIDC